MDRLSSQLTAPIKYALFPLMVLAAIAGSIVWIVAVSPWAALAAVVWLPLIYWLGRFTYRCKDVFATPEQQLLIGHDHVPYSDIASVRSFWFVNPNYVIIKTKSGGQHSFFAPVVVGFNFEEHPVAKLLRERAGLSKS